MKKPRLMALALTAAITLSGVGYAYWTDALTINNTVTTGEMNVKFVAGQSKTRGGDDQTGKLAGDENKSNAYWSAYVNHEGLEAGHNGPATIISENGKTVTTQVNNMYPGSYAQYYGVIENDGTIPVVFDNATIKFDGAEANKLSQVEKIFKNNLKFAFGYVITDADGNKITPNTGSCDGRYYASGKVEDLEVKLNTLLTGVRLEPGQKLSLDFPTIEDAKAAMESIGYQWNEDMHCITYTLSTDAKDNIEDQKLGIHMTINWKQHNAK
ncbi:SipW-dependent-type signal peptide-containing protein [Clostridium sp.]|uniref:SipW-dependent-type signal peptide-containing protein n=1 Tax=Clostridium sp. TaxID=1506 RepID=UPI001A44908B|nr:SipW-dependent-type signal peptide-containing protein [Clostridium sp.]MBK5240638.1 hypothetical protein [Clostridium sp.]